MNQWQISIMRVSLLWSLPPHFSDFSGYAIWILVWFWDLHIYRKIWKHQRAIGSITEFSGVWIRGTPSFWIPIYLQTVFVDHWNVSVFLRSLLNGQEGRPTVYCLCDLVIDKAAAFCGDCTRFLCNQCWVSFNNCCALGEFGFSFHGDKNSIFYGSKLSASSTSNKLYYPPHFNFASFFCFVFNLTG